MMLAAATHEAGRTLVAKGNGRKRRNEPRAKTPRIRVDKGSLQTRLHHARAFLCLNDRARLEILINTPVEKLRAAGQVEVPKSKRPLTDAEEWEAVRQAVYDERERLFAKATNAPHANQRKDPIGRAWYEGLLDGQGVDPTVMRELGREYGWLYWSELQRLDATIGGYDEMLGRPKHRRKFFMLGLTGNEAERFERFETIIRPLGNEVRRCLQKLCCDDMWFLEGPDWLDRCINSRRAARIAKGDKCEAPTGSMARGFDNDTMRNAVMALRALAAGVGR